VLGYLVLGLGVRLLDEWYSMLGSLARLPLNSAVAPRTLTAALLSLVVLCVGLPFVFVLPPVHSSLCVPRTNKHTQKKQRNKHHANQLHGMPLRRPVSLCDRTNKHTLPYTSLRHYEAFMPAYASCRNPVILNPCSVARHACCLAGRGSVCEDQIAGTSSMRSHML
jgi:hypothetical protein